MAQRAMAEKLEQMAEEAVAQGGGVSLDVLCRRAERLINSVRTMAEQVDQMFARPEKTVSDANAAARSLRTLHDGIEGKVAAFERVDGQMNRRLEELQGGMVAVDQAISGLVTRVGKAREMADAFGQLIEASSDKVAALQSAADETREARQALAKAVAELIRVQKAADEWRRSVLALGNRQGETIAQAKASAAELRATLDAGYRLRQAFQQDIQAMRKLLSQARDERGYWQAFTRYAERSDLIPPASKVPPPLKPTSLPTAERTLPQSDADARPSLPAQLAGRIRRLASFIKDAGRSVPKSHVNSDRLSASGGTNPPVREGVLTETAAS